jgi:hypothetical protein
MRVYAIIGGAVFFPPIIDTTRLAGKSPHDLDT